MQHLRASLFVASLAVALVGCPGSLEDPSRFDGQFGDCPDIDMLIATTCAKNNCHAGSNLMGSLDLGSPDIVSRLSGKKAVGGPGLLIDPKDPAKSVLYTKLGSTPPFLSQMPLTGAKLDASTQACFLSWIEDQLKGSTP
jgi:hypothetical protein